MRNIVSPLDGIRSPFGRRLGAAPFSPASLFAASEPGGWYDPSDFDRYMTPGGELLTNGTFASDTSGWTAQNATASVSSGQVTLTNTGANGGIYQAISTVVGRLYSVSIQLVSVTGAGNVLFFIKSDSTNWASPNRINLVNGLPTIQTYTATFTATATTSYIHIINGSSTVGHAVTVDNVSTREYVALDTATLYQDAAGTTPVTAVEQPVGLVLDKSRGLVLGSELVTNGDFSSSAGWVTGTGATISGGKLNLSAASGYVLYRNPVSGVQAGGYYEVTFTVSGYVSGSIRPYLGSTATFGTTVSANGTYTQRFGPTAGGEVGFNAPTAFTGSIDDLSVKAVSGSHLSQSTAAARPVLSARVNLLTRTEELSNAAWINGPISNGTRTNGSVSISNSEGYCYVRQNGTFDAALNYTASFEVTCDQTVSNVPIRVGDAYSLVNVTANVAQRVTLTACKTAAAYVDFGIDARDAIVPGGSNATGYTLTFNKIDLRPANAGVGLPAYQRVGAATDYDTTGFPLYLKFDGTDDSLSSAAINFTSTDKMSVFAGLRKVSDALRGVVFELSDNLSNNNGAAYLFAPQSDGKGNYQFASKGTTASFLDGYTGDNNNYPAPQTRVVTGLTDIGAPSLALRLNGSVAVSGTSTQGTGNFGNYPLHVGRRGGSTLPFNGHIYSLIVRGAATDAATITATETWVNGKTLAY